MRSVREHVNGTDGFHFVEFLELDHFAGEVFVVAGDVDDAFWFGGDNVGQRFVHHAGARRIENNHVGAEFHPVERLCFGIVEFYVDVVELGVNTCIADGVGNEFYADRLLSLSGHGDGEEAGAAVEIQECFIGEIASEVANGGKEHRRGVRVGLEEGVWGNAELDSFDGLIHDAVAVDDAKIVAKGHVGNGVVDAPDDGGGVSSK